ncbi:unnamed protein product, partial [Mesorhabditis belari]|uniref:RNA polymerase II subunit A C-terminal domain phosphatase n=1 Tax=Mesorhabditis belari TaxID=2138241 RepID=A0AAF3F219_9BILA
MDVRFSEEEVPGCVITSKKLAQSSYIHSDKTILEFERPDKSIGKVNAPIEGVVQFISNIRKGFALTPGMTLATIKSCDHSIVIKNLCATCGKDLLKNRDEDGTRESSSASISMIHNVPELIVSNTLAQEIGTEDMEQVLSSRRLILLVDLDQTVIHTTNRPHGSDVQDNPDVVDFQLYGGIHYTKLRPYTREFLENISKLYQLHIVTYGQRQYAHKIASIIDPDGGYFGHRILSRDELTSPFVKTTNLEAIFPRDDLRSMIAIIDDRADVWQFSEALVQVKPYRYFKEIGDINAAASGHGGEPVADLAVNDDDHVLEYMERVLTQVHAAFYRNFDEKNGEIKDLKVIIRYLKSQVLRNTSIVLSGVVPLDMKKRKEEHRSEVYRLCEQFGARIVEDITPETTHLIAVQWGTKKVHEAKKLGIPIVTPGWLYACVERWIKVDEKQFELTANTVLPSRGEGSGRTVLKVVHDVVSFGKKDMEAMLGEVANELGDEDEDEDNKEDENDDEENEDEDDDTNLDDLDIGLVDQKNDVTEPETVEAQETIDEQPSTSQPEPRIHRKRTREELDRGWGENEDPYAEEDDDDDAKRQELDDIEEEERDDIGYADREFNKNDDFNDEDGSGDGVQDEDSDLDEMADELEHELDQ